MSIEEKKTYISTKVSASNIITYRERLDIVKDGEVISSSVKLTTIDPNYSGDGSELPKQVSDIMSKLYTTEAISAFNVDISEESKARIKALRDSALSQEMQDELEKDLAEEQV